MSASPFCTCDCTQWVILAFAVGGLVGMLIMAIINKIEERQKEQDPLTP